MYGRNNYKRILINKSIHKQILNFTATIISNNFNLINHYLNTSYT